MAEEREEQAAGGRPKRRRRWWRRLGLALLLLAGLGYLLREPLVHPLLARLVSRLVTGRAGIELTIEDIDGDWFRTLGVRGLHLATPGPLDELRVDHAQVRFHLFDLLAKRDLSAIEGVSLAGARVGLDLTRGATPPAEAPPATSWVPAPGSFPEIDARDVSFTLRTSGSFELSLAGVDVHSSGTPLARELAASCRDARITGGEHAWRGPLELALRASPSDVQLAHLTSNELRVAEDVSFDWSTMAARRLSWSATLIDGLVRTTGVLDAGHLEGTLRIEDADIAPYTALVPGPVASLVAHIDGAADFALDLDDPTGARASLELEARDIAYLDEYVDRLSASARLQAGVLLVRQLLGIQEHANRLEVADLRIPLRAASLADALAEAQAAVVFEVHDLGLLPFSTTDDLPAHLLQGGGRIVDGRVELDRGRLDFTGGTVHVERGFIDLRAAPLAEREVEIEAKVDIADLSELGHLLGSSEYRGSLSGRLGLEGTLGQPVGDVEWVGRDVRFGTLPLGDLELFARTSQGLVRVESLRCMGPIGELSASGDFLIDSGELDGARLEVRLRDLGPFGLPPGLLELPEPVDLRASLGGSWRSPAGEVELGTAALRLQGHTLEAIDLDLALGQGVVCVERLEFDSQLGHCSARGTADLPVAGAPFFAALDAFVLERGFARLALTEPTSARVEGGAFLLRPVRLAGSAGALTLSASKAADAAGPAGPAGPTVIRGDLHIEARAAGLDLTEFLSEMPVSVRGVDVQLSLEQVSGVSRLTTSGHIARVLATETLDELTLSWSANASDRMLRIDELRIESLEHALLVLSGELPLDLATPLPLADGPLELDGTIDVPPAWSHLVPLPQALGSLAGDLVGELHLGGSWRAVRGDVSLHATDVSLSGPSVAAWFARPADVHLDLALADTVAGTLRAELPGVLGIDAQGRLQTTLDIAALTEDGTAQLERWRTTSLEATGHVDLESLTTLTQGLEGIRRLDGRAAADFRANGPLSDPVLEGTATLDDCELKLTSEVPTLRHLDARLGFDRYSLELEDVRAEMGASPVKLVGRIDWSEPPLALDIQITGEEVLLVRSATNRLRADVDLRLSGPIDKMLLEGEVGLLASRVNQQIDLIPRPSSLSSTGAVSASSRGFQFFSFRDPPLSNMTLDLAIRTIDPLIVSTNLASSSWIIDLTLKGTGRVPTPGGQIFMDETRVKLPAGVMVFDSGRVNFPRENPFVPMVELRGETTLAGYDVTIAVEGAYDQPEVVLSSSPPLGQSELFLLVITGEVPQDAFADSSQRAAQSITLYLAKDIFQRWTTSSSLDDEESLFDRLDVIQGRNVSKSGTQTTEVSFKVDEQVIRERGTLYLVGERDIYESINFGVRLVFRFR